MYYLITPEVTTSVNTPHDLPLPEWIKKKIVRGILASEALFDTPMPIGVSYGPQHFVFNEVGWKLPFVREHELAHATLCHHESAPVDRHDLIRREIDADRIAIEHTSPEAALEVLRNFQRAAPPYLTYPGLQERIIAIEQLIHTKEVLK